MIAEKGNKVLRIDPSDAQRYLDMGYDIKDNGKLIAEALPNSIGALQSKVNSLLEENANLRKEIESLKAKGKEPTKKASKKAEEITE